MLKTDYKDDVFEGNRKYELKTNGGMTEILEVTEFKQQGDLFGAKELNEIGKEVNQLQAVIPITLTAAGWTGTSAPYSQTVTAVGITADMEPVLVRALADGAAAAAQADYNKAFAIIAAGTGVTAAGKVTFKVYKKPAKDCTVGLKGR